MTSKSKTKGNGFEREVVEEFLEAGVEAKRAWGSNGNSLGLHEEVDVVASLWVPDTDGNNRSVEVDVAGNLVYIKVVKELKIQCKRRAKIPNYLGLTNNVDAVVFREDRGETYIMLRLNDFIRVVE